MLSHFPLTLNVKILQYDSKTLMSYSAFTLININQKTIYISTLLQIMKESYLDSYNQKPRSQSNSIKLPNIERRKREQSLKTENKYIQIQPLAKKSDSGFKQSQKDQQKQHANIQIKICREGNSQSRPVKLKKNSTTKKEQLNKIDLRRFQTEQEKNDFDLYKVEDDLLSTLENFKRNISFNKELIQKEICQNRKQNSVQKMKQQKPTQRKSEKKSHLFMNIKKDISHSIPIFQSKQIVKSTPDHVPQKLCQFKQNMRLANLIQKIKKQNPDKSISEMKKINYSQSLEKYEKELKNQKNYIQWRKLDVDGLKNSEPEYQKSCFQIEHKRLSDYGKKNERIMKQFIQNRDQLVKLKLKKIKTTIS